MVRNRKQQTRTNATPGFTIEIKPDTELGLAMLIAEDEEGHHEPVAVASTINEAKKSSPESDFHDGRMRRIEGGNDPGLCPYVLQALGPRN